MDDTRWIESRCPEFIYPKGCQGIYPPKPPCPKPKIEKRLISDEVCGNISQPCDGSFVEYWRAVGLPQFPSATVSVVNKSDCIMTVRADTNGDGVPNATLFQLTERNQTKSVTIGSISQLEVRCQNGSTPSGTCSGTFCLTLHYERDIIHLLD
ncbi:S-Ena type endospore appendage [Metabacillus sp. 84]|uniref:S-Ena type endospore appendage n=1 Tax=unclassified Metabacillus TaxID=2675274 RepID=UPI003CE82ACF